MGTHRSTGSRRLRRAQRLYVTVGAFAFMGPLLVVYGEMTEALLALPYLLSLVLPLACYRFVAAFLATLESVAGRPLVTRLKPIALGTCLPMVGGLVEALLYFRMAKMLKEHADAQDRSGLIVGLALVRPVLAFGLLAAIDGPFSFPWLVFGSFSLVSLSVLAVITQVLVASLLDAVLPAAAHVELGGIGGAEGSVAVSTTNAGQPR